MNDAIALSCLAQPITCCLVARYPPSINYTTGTALALLACLYLHYSVGCVLYYTNPDFFPPLSFPAIAKTTDCFRTLS